MYFSKELKFKILNCINMQVNFHSKIVLYLFFVINIHTLQCLRVPIAFKGDMAAFAQSVKST